MNFQEILPIFWNLLYAPLEHPEMRWISFPLIVMLLLMEFYFGRYRDEELGWNSALANSMVLFFVSIDLFRHIYGGHIISYLLNLVYSFIALSVLLLGIWLAAAQFFHIIPKKIAFIISSSLPINFTAYVSIAIVYANLEVGLNLLLASIILFALLFVIFQVVHAVEWLVFRKS